MKSKKILVLLFALLFCQILSGESCTPFDCENGIHNSMYVVENVTATCEQDGYADVVGRCINCFTETSRTKKTIKAPGHRPVTDPAVEATCTETGLTEGQHCSVCGKVLVAQEVVPAKHTPAAIPGKEPTCTETGLTEGKVCSACGTVLEKQKKIPAKGHTPVTVPGKAASCTESGLTEGKVCSVCGEILTKQREIPAKGHKLEFMRGYPATATEPGLTNGTRCSVCKTVLMPQEVIPPRDEQGGAGPGTPSGQEGEVGKPTYTFGATGRIAVTDPLKGKELKGQQINGLHWPIDLGAAESCERRGYHVAKLIARTVTCEKGGFTESIVCEQCKEVLAEPKLICALDHSYGDWTTEKGDCVTPSTRFHTCSRCGHVETETTGTSGGHNWKTDDYYEDDTSVSGWVIWGHYEKCSKCGATRKVEEGRAENVMDDTVS